MKVLKMKMAPKQLLFAFLMVAGYSPVAISQTYFQQEVNYTIDVSLNDTLHEDWSHL